MTTRPFLGETHDREKAFAGFESIELTVRQDKFEHYSRYPAQREQRFAKNTLPRRLACLNPRCQQGGLDLQQIVEFYSPGEHKLYCNGHEGTPAGKRKGDPCDNQFEITLSVVRRPKER
jgi:hypothetical protein